MEKLLVLTFCQVLTQTFIACFETYNGTELSSNFSESNKDMYIIHAMVYQVGIVTNTTDYDLANATGNQEALTFYHNNGSQVDLSQIPASLLTNVTAQSVVAVAPILHSQENVQDRIPWIPLKDFSETATVQNLDQDSTPLLSSKRYIRKISEQRAENTDIFLDNLYKSLFKRETSDSGTPIELQKGSALIPQSAGIQSIAIPPLLTLNNNLSKIPVPIPNTSVIHYAKINTLTSKQ